MQGLCTRMTAIRPSHHAKSAPRWSLTEPEQLSRLHSIADKLHPTLKERHEVLEEKYRLFPSGCFTLRCDEGIMGYAISHPWFLYDIPPLDTFLHAVPISPNCLYLHDVAILPVVRGQGSTSSLVKLLETVARTHELSCIALTSVYGAEELWTRHRFKHSTNTTSGARISYGENACYMIKDLPN